MAVGKNFGLALTGRYGAVRRGGVRDTAAAREQHNGSGRA